MRGNAAPTARRLDAQRLQRYAPAAVLATYTALAVAWSFVVPLGGGIDEPRHVRYVQIVAEQGRLPSPIEKQEAISHHPPLHYLIAAPVYLATRALGATVAWRAMRLLSVLIGAGTVLLTWLMLRRVFPDRPWLPVVGMAAVGLLPHYQLVCVMVGNDVTVACAGALLLYLTARAIVEPERSLRLSILAGLAAGAAVLAKMNGLLLMPVPLLALAIAARIRRASAGQERGEAGGASAERRTGLINAAAYAVAFGATGGSYVAFHLSRWGYLESDMPWPESTWPVHSFGAKLVRAVEGLYRSTWVQMGWLPGPHSPPPLEPSDLWPRPNLETPVFVLLLPVALIALGGSAVLVVRWLRDGRAGPQGLMTATLLGSSLLTYAAVAHSAVYVHPGRHEGGRYALSAVAATMSLLAIGPLVLPARWRRAVWAATLVLLLAINAISFWEMHTYLVPTFAP